MTFGDEFTWSLLTIYVYVFFSFSILLKYICRTRFNKKGNSRISMIYIIWEAVLDEAILFRACINYVIFFPAVEKLYFHHPTHLIAIVRFTVGRYIYEYFCMYLDYGISNTFNTPLVYVCVYHENEYNTRNLSEQSCMSISMPDWSLNQQLFSYEKGFNRKSLLII